MACIPSCHLILACSRYPDFQTSIRTEVNVTEPGEGALFSVSEQGMSSRRKRSLAPEEDNAVVRVDMEGVVEEPQSVRPVFDLLPQQTSLHNSVIAGPKEIERFHKIAADAQAQCVKSVVRLFVMKGTCSRPCILSFLC
jgi:hypothetical protein